MDRNDVSWRGYWAASPTPFKSDVSYDADAHRALLDWYIGEGLHGVLINGTTGEWFSQTHDQRRRVAETAIEHVAGGIRFVRVGGAFAAGEAGALASHAAAAGADGVESTAP